MTVYTVEAQDRLFCVCRNGRPIAQCSGAATAWRKAAEAARREAEREGKVAVYRTDPSGTPRAAWVVR